MTDQRIVGLDIVKGIAIFMMIIVHVFTQVIADYDGGVFLSIRDKIPQWILVPCIYPLVIIGLWGTIFTFITAITTALSAIRIMSTNRKAMPKYLLQRLLFLLILRFADCLCNNLFGTAKDFALKNLIRLPCFIIPGAATTIDSIGWAGILSPILIILMYPLIKHHNKSLIIGVYTCLAIVSIGLSPYVVSACKAISVFFHSTSILPLEDLFGKVAYGRFKIANTIPFMIMGCMMGVLIHLKSTIEFLVKLSTLYFALCLVSFIVWVLLIPSVVDHIVDEEVPLAAHVLSLGCEMLFTFGHAWYYDGNRSMEAKLRSRKRSTYLFRLNAVSLTVFCVGSWVPKKLAIPWVFVLGPPCQHTPKPVLLWGALSCIGFTVYVLVAWLLGTRLWERANFAFSLEYWIGMIMAKLARKEFSIDAKKIVYGPAEALEAEMKGDSNNENETKSIEIPSNK